MSDQLLRPVFSDTAKRARVNGIRRAQQTSGYGAAERVERTLTSSSGSNAQAGVAECTQANALAME